MLTPENRARAQTRAGSSKCWLSAQLRPWQGRAIHPDPALVSYRNPNSRSFILEDRKEALAGSVSATETMAPSFSVRPPAVRSSPAPNNHTPEAVRNWDGLSSPALRPRPGQSLTMPRDASTHSRCLDTLGLERV